MLPSRALLLGSLLAVTLTTLAACARPDATAASCSGTPGASASAENGGSCALPSAPITSRPTDRNVDGQPLALCSSAPLTGYFRDGRCSTGAEDTGVHVVCSEVTDAFLQFSKGRGNDLVTPRGAFAGLKAGDRWCLCAARWQEAEAAGAAPPVILEATHEAAITIVKSETLRAHRLAR